MLTRNRVQGTFCVNAKCAELFPDAVAGITKAGHDIAGHGYFQDELLAYMTPEDEKRTIKRCLELLEKTGSVRPKGWISPVLAFTEHTRRLLAEEKLIWDADARDNDLPEVVKTDAGAIVHMPASDFTDNRVLRGNPMTLWDVYKETFDYLYLREPPAFLGLTLHCHFGGRPLVTAIFDKVLRYIREFPDVWFASYGEIAQWTLDTQRDADTHARRLLSPASRGER